MASKFYIIVDGRSNPSSTTDGTVHYIEDGTEVTTPEAGKDYSTEAAAQAIIDSNPTWIATAKADGATFSVAQHTIEYLLPFVTGSTPCL